MLLTAYTLQCTHTLYMGAPTGAWSQALVFTSTPHYFNTSPSSLPLLPSPIALPSPMGTSGLTCASLSGQGLSPQSTHGLDASCASCPIHSLPACTGAPRLASSPESTTAAAAAASTLITAVPAAVSPVMAPSVPTDPALVTFTSEPEIDLNVDDWPDHVCVCYSHCRQKCAIPEGHNPLNMSKLCLRCIHNKKVCD